MRRTTSCFHVTRPLELYHRYACVDRAASDSSRRFVVPSTEGSTPQDCLLQAPRKLHDLSEETVHCDSAQWRAHNSTRRQDDNLTPSATVTPRFAHTKRGFATVRLPHAGTRPRGPARLPSVRSTCSQGSIELGGRVAVIADRPSLYPPHSRRHNRSDRHFLFHR